MISPPATVSQGPWLPRLNVSHDGEFCSTNESALGSAARFCAFRRKLLLGSERCCCAPWGDISLVVSRSMPFAEGGSNMLRRLVHIDETVALRRGIHRHQWPQNASAATALLRTSKPRSTPRAVRDAWVLWELSRLGVAPPTLAAWLEQNASSQTVRLHSIVQEWGTPLKHAGDFIADSPRAATRALENAVEEQIRAVARSGLILSDLKSAHVLVRSRSDDAGGAEAQAIGSQIGPLPWEVRLVDFDYPFAHPVPCVSADCRLLFMLSLLAAEMACGPAHRSAFTTQIMSLSQKEPRCAAWILGRSTGTNISDAFSAGKCAPLWATMRVVKRNRAFLIRDGTDPNVWESYRGCVLDLRRGGLRSLERRGRYNYSSWIQLNREGNPRWIQVNREGNLRGLSSDL